jgi:hypothetical protein
MATTRLTAMLAHLSRAREPVTAFAELRSLIRLMQFVLKTMQANEQTTRANLVPSELCLHPRTQACADLQAQLYHDPATYKDWESPKKCQERSITIWGRVGNSIFDNTSAHPNKRLKFTPRFKPQQSTQGPPAHKLNAVKKLEV